MKGKLAETVKKWWMIVLVATLALSLTSCGRKRTSLLSGGIQCADPVLGDFDVALYPAGNNQFEVVIVPYEAYVDEISFSVSQLGGTSRTLSTLAFNNSESQEYTVGFMTMAEVYSGFDTLVLDGYFLNGQYAGGLECVLPLPNGR